MLVNRVCIVLAVKALSRKLSGKYFITFEESYQYIKKKHTTY